jgi:hypothetical protein
MGQVLFEYMRYGYSQQQLMEMVESGWHTIPETFRYACRGRCSMAGAVPRARNANPA